MLTISYFPPKRFAVNFGSWPLESIQSPYCGVTSEISFPSKISLGNWSRAPFLTHPRALFGRSFQSASCGHLRYASGCLVHGISGGGIPGAFTLVVKHWWRQDVHCAVVCFSPLSFLVESFHSFFKTVSACSAARSLQSISLKGENSGGRVARVDPAGHSGNCSHYLMVLSKRAFVLTSSSVWAPCSGT